MAVVLAFIFPSTALHLKILIIPYLMLLMTLSLKDISLPKFSKTNINYAIKMMLLNFFFYSSVLLLSSLFVSNIYYKIGFVMLAAAPPAVMVVPFTKILGGNMVKTIFSETMSYVFAILYMPLIAFIFLSKYINIISLVKVLLLFIIIPYTLSRFLNKVRIKYDFKEIINILFCFGIYLGIALASQHIKNNYISLIPLFLIIIVPKFLYAFALNFFVKKRKLRKTDAISAVLFGSFKNSNMVIAINLLLFPPQAILPAAMVVFSNSFYIFYVSKKFKM